jgi:roadblock/LC7 domain-containing protein
MATLNELLNLKGAVAACESTRDGKLLDYKAKMDISRDLAQSSAQFGASVAMLFNTLGGAFTQMSKMN